MGARVVVAQCEVQPCVVQHRQAASRDRRREDEQRNDPAGERAKTVGYTCRIVFGHEG